MPIYTRRGDKGKTRIYGGREFLAKTDTRVVALGTIDELNSQLGVVFSFLAHRNERPHGALAGKIRRVQTELFEISSELAASNAVTPPFKLRKNKVRRLERWIDFYWNKMPPLANFIFSGGTPAASHLQVARAISRRAERAVIRLSSESRVSPAVLAYLNRLSDVLHTLSRWSNYLEGVQDEIWWGINKRK